MICLWGNIANVTKLHTVLRAKWSGNILPKVILDSCGLVFLHRGHLEANDRRHQGCVNTWYCLSYIEQCKNTVF